MEAYNFPESIKGEFIELKKTTMNDAVDIYRWRTSRSGRYMRKVEDYSVESQREWIASRGSNEVNYIICDIATGQKVGTVGIYDINWVDKVANVGRLLLDAECLTKSTPYGLEALKVTYDYVFNIIGFHKITGDILGLNADMFKLQIFLGMKQEGYLKEHVWIEGEYRDLYIMSIFKPDFLRYSAKINILLKNFR